MLKNHLAQKITDNLRYIPTPGQQKLIELLSDFITDDNQDRLLLVKGYAGTGKTTIISALVSTFKQFKIKSVLLAPTGRAAKVITNYSKNIAFTIHKKIYRQKSSRDGFGRFVLNKNLYTNTFFIVDEASMISNLTDSSSIFGTGNLLDDLYEYVYSGKGCKLILIGDTAQLPPVGLSESPSLQKLTVESYGLQVDEIELNEVIRQEKGSDILINATQIRDFVKTNNHELPFLKANDKRDFIKISGADLIECLDDSYGKCGLNETIVVTRSNKRANKYNEGIRNQILFKENEIEAGDHLMIVKNNYFWLGEGDPLEFIANGDIAEIKRIKKHYELYGFRFADVMLSFPDYNGFEVELKILLDTLTSESASLSSEENKKLFFSVMEDYQDLRGKKRQYDAVKNNPFFNALQVKFAYAVTCHKAQGGQWKHVFIDQGYITDDRMDNNYFRWLYTAITRASEKVYLVNFPEKYFKNN